MLERKKVTLSSGEVLKLRSLTLSDITEENQIVDFIINILDMIEKQTDGEEMMDTLFRELPDVCYSIISLSITPEGAEIPTMPLEVKHLYNLQDQLTLLTEVILLSIPDKEQLLKQKKSAERISEKVTKLLGRLK